jgi:hypothetical protein
VSRGHRLSPLNQIPKTLTNKNFFLFFFTFFCFYRFRFTNIFLTFVLKPK